METTPFGTLGIGTTLGKSAEFLPVAGGHVFQSLSAKAFHFPFVCASPQTVQRTAGDFRVSVPKPRQRHHRDMYGDYIHQAYAAGCPWLSRVAIAFAPLMLVESLPVPLPPRHRLVLGQKLQGTLGNGTEVATSTPTRVAGELRFWAVSAGFGHACGVTTAGRAFCWGNNRSGQLGDGKEAGSLVPSEVAGGLVFESISAGLFHTCVVTPDGAAYCWGDGSTGALGNGQAAVSRVPVKVITFR